MQESKTNPEARLYRKGHGQEARLAYLGHVLMENRQGLIVEAMGRQPMAQPSGMRGC